MDILSLILAKKQLANDVDSIITEKSLEVMSELDDAIESINDKIPMEASNNNKLADKSYVNAAINDASAFFRGSFATKAALLDVEWQTSNENAPHFVSNNDFAYVEADETHDNQVWRYCYKYKKNASDNGWRAQYMINETTFTKDQWNTINSGLTATEKTKLDNIEAGAQVNTVTGVKGFSESSYRTGNINISKVHIGLSEVNNTSDLMKPISTATQAALDNKQDTLTFDNAPAQNSKNPVTSGGVYTAINNVKPKIVDHSIIFE